MPNEVLSHTFNHILHCFFLFFFLAAKYTCGDIQKTLWLLLEAAIKYEKCFQRQLSSSGSSKINIVRGGHAHKADLSWRQSIGSLLECHIEPREAELTSSVVWRASSNEEPTRGKTEDRIHLHFFSSLHPFLPLSRYPPCYPPSPPLSQSLPCLSLSLSLSHMRFLLCLRTHALFSTEVIAQCVGSQVSSGYTEMHCFAEIKLICRRMIKSVYEWLSPGTAQISGAR